MRFWTVAAASAILALTAPALAAGVFEKTFAATPCYARTYDAAHFARHPRQTVAGMTIAFAPANPDGARNSAARFELGFGFGLRNGEEWFSGNAICHGKGATFECALEGDGGLFRLTPRGGNLRFEVVNRGGTDANENQINLEGDDFAGFGKPGGDDLVFDLKPAAVAACNTSTGYGG